MDAFFPAFVAALIAEFGDKTQLLALALAVHFRRLLPVLAGVALAALANAALAAFGSVLVAPLLTHDAALLMMALALIFAGGGAFWPQRAPDPISVTRPGAFLVSFGSFFILELGDKTQFFTFAIALRSGAPWMTLAGATLGVVLATLLAMLAARDLGRLPVTVFRRTIGVLFLIAGSWCAVMALRLV